MDHFLLKPGLARSSERNARFFRCAGPIYKDFDCFRGIGLQELQASQRRANRSFDQIEIFFYFVFVHAETGDGVSDDFRSIAKDAIAILHLNVCRQGHQATLGDVFFHSCDPRRGSAHRQQLVFALLQAQVLQMFSVDCLGIAEGADGKYFSSEIGRRFDLWTYD